MKLLGALIAMTLMASSVSAESRQRDWTIEKPVLAGFLNGLTLTACGGCNLGEQSEAANQYDPFAMTVAAQEELQRLARTPFEMGRLFGVACTSFLVFGIIYRRSNTLVAMESHQ